jgi:hypothetical protein
MSEYDIRQIDVDRMFEWSVANRVNRIEWVLLGAKDWEAFAWSDLRRSRLSDICNLAHQYGIGCGADVALAIRQQVFTMMMTIIVVSFQ